MHLKYWWKPYCGISILRINLLIFRLMVVLVPKIIHFKYGLVIIFEKGKSVLPRLGLEVNLSFFSLQVLLLLDEFVYYGSNIVIYTRNFQLTIMLNSILQQFKRWKPETHFVGEWDNFWRKKSSPLKRVFLVNKWPRFTFNLVGGWGSFISVYHKTDRR